MSETISFVIPHKGREGMLLETLQSIISQDYPTDALEVIVVSQNDTASETLSALRSEVKLTVIFNQPDKTISHSRNLGAAHASGSYLAFLDADIALSDNWVSTMLSTLKSQPDTRLVSAMQINSNDASPLERIRTALSNAELDTFVAFLPGRNLFLHNDTFNDVGGFPEHLLTCEDYYFTDQVNKLGNLFYTSEANYVHLGEDKEYIPMFKKEIWRGQSNLASLSGRSIPLREWPSFLVPFAVVGGILLGLLMLILTHFDLSALFFVIGLLPLAAYTVRLKKLTKNETGWMPCLLFYVMYFPARAIGTLLGIGGTVRTSSHK